MKKKFMALIITLSLCVGAISGAYAASNVESISALLNRGVTVNYYGTPQTFTSVDGSRLYPITYGGYTYLPLRAVSNLFGVPIDWNSDTNTVDIGTKAVTPVTPATPSTSANSNAVTAVDGYAEGKIGTVFQTAFFEYSVDDVKYTNKYENYTAPSGMQLVDATITIKNTFGEPLPMFIGDFQLQWHDLGDGNEDYNFGVIIDNSKTVMPAEYTLDTDGTVTYHVIFEAPKEAKEFSIDFLEYFDDYTEGDMFFTYFEK